MRTPALLVVLIIATFVLTGCKAEPVAEPETVDQAAPASEAGDSDAEVAHAVAMAHSQAAGPVKIELAAPVARVEGPDGHTVAELYALRDELEGQVVAVRGQVSKFNAAIMDRNWLHLQDGSGTGEGGDFDLTVTTGDAAAPGDVVVVRGTLRTDRDFGAGYRYPVIIEEARLDAAGP